MSFPTQTRSNIAEFEHAWAAAEAGDFSAPAVQHLAPHFRTALLAQRWLAQPSQGALPNLAELDAFSGGEREVGIGAALTCTVLERQAFLAFDLTAFRSVLERHEAIAHGLDHPVSQLRLEAAKLWLAALSSPTPEIVTELQQLRGVVARAELAALVVDLTALEAIVVMALGDLGDATELARRASRMARTEALPQCEYLANLVLARVRRMCGRPHLAIRILQALIGIAPEPWHNALHWEMILAGATPPAPSKEDESPATALAKLLDCIRDADRSGVDRWTSYLTKDAPLLPMHQAELNTLRAVLDPTPSSPSSPWCRGDAQAAPVEFLGLCSSADVSQHESAVAYVLLGPNTAPRRLLSPATALAESEFSAQRLPQEKRRQGRLDTAAAILGLAGDAGQLETEFFEAVYEFPYEPELHKGALEMLIHRLRARLAGLGTVERQRGRLQLAATSSLLLPDPSCSVEVSDKVLRLLAAHKGITANEAAKRLHISLRSVQAALSSLMADGACRSRKAGRRVEYDVEDTTFSEPTRFH